MLGWLIGLVMLIEGVFNALSWNDRRKLGLADGWSLLGAIISIVLGACVIGSMAVQYAFDTFLAYMVAAWLAFSGIMRIAGALSMRKMYQHGNVYGANWLSSLLLGVIILVLGVACFVQPALAMAYIGILLGIAILITGIGIIAASCIRKTNA